MFILCHRGTLYSLIYLESIVLFFFRIHLLFFSSCFSCSSTLIHILLSRRFILCDMYDCICMPVIFFDVMLSSHCFLLSFTRFTASDTMMNSSWRFFFFGVGVCFSFLYLFLRLLVVFLGVRKSLSSLKFHVSWLWNHIYQKYRVNRLEYFQLF